MNFQDLLLAIGALCIFIGMMRLIYINARDVNNVSMVRWAMTGGIIELVYGLVFGTVNLVMLRPDQNSRNCLLIWFGMFCIYLTL